MNYFDRLKRDQRVCERFRVDVKFHELGRVESVFERTEPGHYSEKWCVVDVEHNPSQLNGLVSMLRKLNVRTCFSNPCFEVWLLMHFKCTSRSFLNADQAIAELNSHWRREFECDYDKSSTSIYDRVQSLTDAAITNAKRVLEQMPSGREANHCPLRCNCSTEMYKLTQNLLYSPISTSGIAEGAKAVGMHTRRTDGGPPYPSAILY